MAGLRILLCCPNGAGISLMLESMVQTAARQLGCPIQQLYHCSIREGQKIAGAFDLVLCHQFLVPQLDPWVGQVTVLGLNNPLSPRELREKFAAVCQENGWNTLPPK